MKCEAEGKILVELPSTGGVTRDGKDWEKREYIMETSERYHSKMRFPFAVSMVLLRTLPK